MAFYAFKTIDVGSVSAGASTEKTWTSDDDYTIHKIRFIEKSAGNLYQYEVTISVDNYVITKDTVSASVFVGNWNQIPILDISIKKAQVIKFSIENNESAARDCYIVLELHK